MNRYLIRTKDSSTHDHEISSESMRIIPGNKETNVPSILSFEDDGEIVIQFNMDYVVFFYKKEE